MLSGDPLCSIKAPTKDDGRSGRNDDLGWLKGHVGPRKDRTQSNVGCNDLYPKGT